MMKNQNVTQMTVEDKDSSDEKDAQKLETECELDKINDNKVEKNNRNLPLIYFCINT